ncbi:hypothetical protein E3P99_01258 [Wallemia hederae]|uniref:Glycoside hydrolase family 5 C-terminal domain-containing protein n=1 Tax=Wallemia hederae TaxID=1540922 RepID=A0A4T0FS08_9BASI|nr:hypothetical protein E3P99_01258 [Wallemia hederae]
MLITEHGHFIDSLSNRVVTLRGVNLADAKIPNDTPTQLSTNFYDDAENGRISYTRRPFPADALDSHLSRLSSFGYNCIRYVIPWEALEHAGPGIYDEDFIAHTIHTLRKLKQYGFYVYIDPHQDLWSRFVGGSGAPIWTVHACGLQPRNFMATEAALIHNEWRDGARNFPDMIWATNYYRLAAYTIFTLFFAGKTFAPRCVIDGVNIQDYLQQHYVSAYKHLAEAIHAAEYLEDSCVLGWDSMNEPSGGMIGYRHLAKLFDEQKVKLGSCPTPHQAFQMGMGHRTAIQYWEFTSLGPKRRRDVTVDPKGALAWLRPEDEPDGKSTWGWTRHPDWELGRCIWAQHGVWDDETLQLLQPAYFSEGNPTAFVDKYWKTFVEDWGRSIRSVHRQAILWIAPPVFEQPCAFDESVLGGRAALSHHYYDGLTLMTKDWHFFNADAVGLLRHVYKSVLFALKFGERAIRKSFREQMGVLQSDARLLSHSHTYPTMIGELGIPYDMRKTKPRVKRGVRSRAWNADYRAQSKAMDVSLGACDGSNCLSYTVWSYAAGNTHEWGDGWNGEDLSIWSPDDVRNEGGSGSGSSSSSKLLTSQSQNQSQSRSLDDTSLMPLVSGRAASSSSSTSSNNVDLLDGCRAPEAFVRPYLAYTAGVPLSMEYSIAQRRFEARVGCTNRGAAASDDASQNTTEVFIPRFTFSNPVIHVSEGTYQIVHDRVFWEHDIANGSDKTIVVTDSSSAAPGTSQRPPPPQRSFSQSVLDMLSRFVHRFI